MSKKCATEIYQRVTAALYKVKAMLGSRLILTSLTFRTRNSGAQDVVINTTATAKTTVKCQLRLVSRFGPIYFTNCFGGTIISLSKFIRLPDFMLKSNLPLLQNGSLSGIYQFRGIWRIFYAFELS